MQLTKSTSTGQGKLYSGIFEGRIVMVNPDREQKAAWKGWEVKPEDKEYEYIGEDKDKNTRVTIEFCIEDVADPTRKFDLRFNITDKKVVSEKSGKNQYVSATGMSSWVTDTKDLPEWFTTFRNKEKEKIGEVDYRKAYQGEASLYDFLRSYLAKVDWFSPSTNILLDMKKIFRGNVDEIRSLIPTKATPEDEILAGTVVMLATVYIKDDAEGKKMYQNVSSNNFLPGYRMKTVRLSATQNSWDSDKNTKRFKDQILDPEHGVKEAFTWDLIEEFDEEKSLQSSNDVIRHDTTEVSDTDY